MSAADSALPSVAGRGSGGVAVEIADATELSWLLQAAERELLAAARTESHLTAEQPGRPPPLAHRVALAALYRVWDRLGEQLQLWGASGREDGEARRAKRNCPHSVRLLGSDLAVLEAAAVALNQSGEIESQGTAWRSRDGGLALTRLMSLLRARQPRAGALPRPRQPASDHVAIGDPRAAESPAPWVSSTPSASACRYQPTPSGPCLGTAEQHRADQRPVAVRPSRAGASRGERAMAPLVGSLESARVRLDAADARLARLLRSGPSPARASALARAYAERASAWRDVGRLSVEDVMAGDVLGRAARRAAEYDVACSRQQLRSAQLSAANHKENQASTRSP